MEDIGDKNCSKCGLKPKSEFRPDARSSDGLKSWCRRCELNKRYSWLRTNEGKAYTRRKSYTILRFGHSKNKAKRKSIEWSLTKDQFKLLATNECHYCGDKFETTGSGLDRKDPSIGYTSDNVVPCCNICNTMKLDYWTYTEMLEIGMLVKILKAKRLTSS